MVARSGRHRPAADRSRRQGRHGKGEPDSGTGDRRRLGSDRGRRALGRRGPYGAGTGQPRPRADWATRAQAKARAPRGRPPADSSSSSAPRHGVYAVAGYLPFSSKTGLVQSLRAKAKAKAPKVPLDTFIDNGYAAVEVVAHAAKGQKQVTSATLMKALPKVRGFNTGLGTVVTLTKPGVVARKYPRLFNPNVYLWVVRNGQMVLAQPKPVNIGPGMKLL